MPVMALFSVLYKKPLSHKPHYFTTAVLLVYLMTYTALKVIW